MYAVTVVGSRWRGGAADIFAAEDAALEKVLQLRLPLRKPACRHFCSVRACVRFWGGS
jgi:hypothetical protein